MNKNDLIYKFFRNCYHTVRKVYLPYITMHNQAMVNKNLDKIRLLQNSHTGQRCFIIGNGPSLSVDDLEKLKGEICFGTHRIYEIYSKTDWRPTYYCAQDSSLIKTSAKDIKKKVEQNKYIGIFNTIKYPKIQNAVYLNIVLKNFESGLSAFSEDISKCFYEGYTVTYMCLQMAVYMGFKEIYLLGIDHNYSTMIDESGNMVHQEGIKDHFSDKDLINNIPRLDKSTLAYISAKKYADSHGIKIYNATRGGKLEIFERINFDDLFNKESEK